MVFCQLIGINIGTPKAIDGLLRISDNIKMVIIFPVYKNSPEYFPLNRIRILELINQGIFPALPKKG